MSLAFQLKISLSLIVLLLTNCSPAPAASRPAPVGAISAQVGTNAQPCEFWIAPRPEGKDSNPGSFEQPWATLRNATKEAPDQGCTIWLKDGIYEGHNQLNRRFTKTTIFKAVHPYKAILQNNGKVLSLNGTSNMIFEGIEFRHEGPGADRLVISVHRDEEVWADNITFRNNIIHDSYNDDLLKLWDGVRNVTVANNVFYNMGALEQHMDVNSVSDVIIQDNIFFNDYAGSQRKDPGNTKNFIVIKDSGEGQDGMKGSQRVYVRRNIFLNWAGTEAKFLKVGNDGKPFHEGREIYAENNLFIGNSGNLMDAAFGVSGGKDIYYVNNTVVGDLPSGSFAFRFNLKGKNPQNENIFFYNNIWSDPTGTMGAGPLSSGIASALTMFSDGIPSETKNLVLDNNLYWNGGDPIPAGNLVSPLDDDAHRIVADPQIIGSQGKITLPRWNGSAFLSGNKTIREEFIRLVEHYGKIQEGSPAIGKANPEFSPEDDILGRKRSNPPDLGAYEYLP
jgi:hypothetical protein